MRKTITGTGGMLLLQTLKDAGVEYLFTNPGSAETGIFAALAEDGDQRLVVGKHEGLEAQIGEAAEYRIERPAPARAQTVEAIARRLGEAHCPVVMFGDDVWRDGAQAEAVRLAEVLEAPVFSTRQIFANFPTRHPL